MQVISLPVILLWFALVKSTMYEVYGNNVTIFRGDKDKFTRQISCSESKAACFDESCVYCQCIVGQTFVRTRGNYGECVSNELLIYATCKLLNVKAALQLPVFHTHVYARNLSKLVYTSSNFLYKYKIYHVEN